MKYIIRIVILMIGIVGIYVGFNQINDKPEGDNYNKCITIIVTLSENSNDYDYCTNQEFLGEVVEANISALDAEFTGSITDAFGRLLVQLEGYQLKSNEFFFIYVDQEYGLYGVDQQVIEDGGTYEFRLGAY